MLIIIIIIIIIITIPNHPIIELEYTRPDLPITSVSRDIPLYKTPLAATLSSSLLTHPPKNPPSKIHTVFL
jgi:hypothetical protein